MKKFITQFLRLRLGLFFFLTMGILATIPVCAAAKKKPASYFLLVTGCGRSGTTYIAELLQKSGLEIFHERLGKDGCASWFMASKDDHLSNELIVNAIKFKHIFHQVRNPLDVITSWYTNKMDPRSWTFIYKNIPEIDPKEPLLVRCAKYWYYWNLLVEKKAHWRYRIEDIAEVLPEMGQRLQTEIDKEILTQIQPNINSWSNTSKKVSWSDLKNALSEHDFNNIQNLAIKYGYAVEEQK